MAILDIDKKGYYLVGWKKFHNKIQALQYSTATGFDVRWIFNDDVYSKFDWTVPITKSLKELYKNRAQQLRDTYDYVVLQYSGGQDSNNVLHSFIDNDIHIDKIILQVPEPQRKRSIENNTSWQNYWGEIDFQAIPYLKKFEHQLRNTVIEIQDMSVATLELFKNDNWTEAVTPNASYNLGVISRVMGQYKDATILQLSEKGKTSCNILGIDKPLVYFDGSEYFCLFADQSAYHIQPMDSTLNDLYNISTTEFFYWTPDMPEIVIKQAQEIKAYCIANDKIRELFKQTTKQDVGIFREVMQYIIYDTNHAPEFQTAKPGQNAGKILNAWFYDAGGKLFHNYEYAIEQITKKIKPNYFAKNNHTGGFSTINSKTYKL